jgi:hypothetical protein
MVVGGGGSLAPGSHTVAHGVRWWEGMGGQFTIRCNANPGGRECQGGGHGAREAGAPAEAPTARGSGQGAAAPARGPGQRGGQGGGQDPFVIGLL